MKLLWPLKGISKTPGVYITQYFGGNPQIYSQFGLKGHNGIDIAAPLGTPVMACHDGGVIMNPQDPDGYGIYARVYWEENGYRYDSVYGHFQKIEGGNREVKAGDIIGYVNSTGFSSGNHLHFGLRRWKNGVIENYNNGYLGYFDPLPYMKIRVPRWVGYKYSKQKDFYLPLPDLETEKAIKNGTLKLTDIYQFEDYEINSGINYPPL